MFRILLKLYLRIIFLHDNLNKVVVNYVLLSKGKINLRKVNLK